MNTSSGSEDDDPLREARAYNESIYFMVSMPFLLLGAVSFMVYLEMKAAQKRAVLIDPASASTEDLANSIEESDETRGPGWGGRE